MSLAHPDGWMKRLCSDAGEALFDSKTLLPSSFGIDAVFRLRRAQHLLIAGPCESATPAIQYSAQLRWRLFRLCGVTRMARRHRCVGTGAAGTRPAYVGAITLRQLKDLHTVHKVSC
jgi:hypothetical protein